MINEAGKEVSVSEVADKVAHVRPPVRDLPGQTVIAGMEGERKVEKKPRGKRSASKFMLCGIGDGGKMFEVINTSNSLVAFDKVLKQPDLPEGVYVKLTIRETVKVLTETARRVSVIKG